jgi:hypothetical protein
LKGVELRFESASPRDYFSGKRPDIDAFALLAASGSAWSLLYPAYSLVVPQPRPLHWPAGVAMRKADRDLAEFVDEWLVIARSSGAVQRAYDYWVLGKGAETTRRRWSVMHNVLGWGR